MTGVKPRHWLLDVLVIFVALATIFVALMYASNCGGPSGGRGQAQQPSPPPPAPPLQPCDTVVTFDQLQPQIAANCASCHVGYDTYDVAKSKIGDFISRIAISAGQPGHMPASRPDLDQKTKDLFANWQKDGFLKPSQCTGTANPPSHPVFHDLAWAEEQMFNDVNSVTAGDQPNIRYLIAIDQTNLGIDRNVVIAKNAANKAINSVSLARDVQPVLKVADGIWRINLDKLEISTAQWTQIENASLLQMESQTQRGLALKTITKSRLPWFDVAEFNDVVLHNPTIYYLLTHAPTTFNQLVTNLGVSFNGDLANFKAILFGFNGSALAPAANRLIGRWDSHDGFFYATFDSGPIVSSAQNLFNNPLLAGAGGKANFKFAAGEQLYSLPNGMIGWFLSNANGDRLDAADPVVVHNFVATPISPVIHISIDCSICHNNGIIHAVDQIRSAVPESNIGADDTNRVLALYKVQPTIDAAIAKDILRFSTALQTLGIDGSDPDPISAVSDRFLGDLTLEQLSAFVFKQPSDMKACIGLSQLGRQQAAQLLNGGTISHDQLVQVFGQLKTDCRLFQDPLAN